MLRTLVVLGQIQADIVQQKKKKKNVKLSDEIENLFRCTFDIVHSQQL